MYYQKEKDHSVTILIILLVLCFLGYLWIDASICSAKTRDMGFEHRYTVMGGCQIQVNDNQWIPLESYYFKQE